MACCVVALAMVYRLIDAWCRCRDWVRHVPRQARDFARAPAVRATVILAACVEIGAIGGFALAHREHLQDWTTQALVATSSLASNLCQSLPPSLQEP